MDRPFAARVMWPNFSWKVFYIMGYNFKNARNRKSASKILKQPKLRPLDLKSLKLNALSCRPKAWKISGITDAISPARHQKSSQHVRACAAGDGAICSKNRRIVPYHGDSPNTRNGARLRSPSLIMAPVGTYGFQGDGGDLYTTHTVHDIGTFAFYWFQSFALTCAIAQCPRTHLE